MKTTFYHISKNIFVFSFCLFSHLVFGQASTWTAIATPAPEPSGSLMFLLSDGSVLCKSTYGTADNIGNHWNRLTPDAFGSYINGTWSKACPMRDSRLYFSSQLLKNGKLYVAGGEYGMGSFDAELFDPTSNSWTQLPNTNNYLGDASSCLLPNGKVLQASLSAPGVNTLLFNPQSNAFSNGPNCLGGHNESTWIKLQDNSILFVNVGSTASERFIPALNQWTLDAPSPSNLYDAFGFETGPGFLLPDGRVFFIGSLGNTAFYTPSGNTSPGTWSAGPTMPNNHGMPDAPGSMLVDGKIIVAAGPKPNGPGAANIFIAPTYFYEFDYLTNTFSSLVAPGGGTTVADTAFNSNMLTLPDGSVMYSQLYKSTYYVYKPNGAPLAVAKPTITSVNQGGCSNTFTLTGLLFNGIGEGSCYGDDWQMSSNYPIVKLSSGANVYYARSFNWNHNGVRNFTNADTTLFELPANLPNATYSLSVIANGVSSNPISFTFSAFPSLTSVLSLPDRCSGSTVTYTPSANLPGTTMAWTRAAVSGITNAAIATPQTANPNEILINSSAASRTAVYAYTLSNGSCITHYNVSVVVHPTNTLTFLGTAKVCATASITVKASGALSYTWNTGVISSSFVVTPSLTTTYTVNARDHNNCPINAQITITVMALPTLSISGTNSICAGESTTLSAQGNGFQYVWSGQLGNVASVVVSPNNSTSYTVTSVSAQGCQSKDSVAVRVDGCLGVEEESTAFSQISVIPNPVTESAFIELTSSELRSVHVELKDVYGRVLEIKNVTLEIGVNRVTLDFTGYETGIYFIFVSADTMVKCVKLVKG